MGLLRMFNALNGHNTDNEALAELTYNQASALSFITQP